VFRMTPEPCSNSVRWQRQTCERLDGTTSFET
jgi:hypothetical protein